MSRSPGDSVSHTTLRSGRGPITARRARRRRQGRVRHLCARRPGASPAARSRASRSPSTPRTTRRSPRASSTDPRRRPRGLVPPRHRDRADAAPGRGRRRGRPHRRLGPTRVGGAHRRRRASAPDLPDMRPGCGSLSVDPDMVDELAVRFGGVGAAQPPGRARRARGRGRGAVRPGLDRRPARRAARPRHACCGCSTGTTRAPDEVVAVVPPDLVECTVEKVAINAVMAGCRPEYLPVVLAARRGRVHRRVQHPRPARHHDAGRPGRHRQRPDPPAPSA